VILALFIALTALMALVCFGLSVLVIEVVGWLWPANSKAQLDRVVMITGARNWGTERFPVQFLIRI
jgi:hypothetical protein